MTKLYYIQNCGCDDETSGLIRISDEDFPKFKSFVENLNRNSTYGCMPVIYLHEIQEDDIQVWNEAEHCDYERLYLDGEIYALKKHIRPWELEVTAGKVD